MSQYGLIKCAKLNICNQNYMNIKINGKKSKLVHQLA